MRKRRSRGVSSIEFAFGMLVLLPLMLGTGVTGINLIRTLQTVQLARDAGHMYAKSQMYGAQSVNFASAGNQSILVSLGSGLGLSATAGQGSAVVILSSLTYVGQAQCSQVGAVDASGNPTSACTNYGKWVFTQQLVIGNTSVRNSNYGSPLTSGPTGVTPDPVTQQIPEQQYVKQAGAVANFSGVNPYTAANGGSGLPSGQFLYVAEAASTGFNMPPFVSGAVAYSWTFF